VDISSGWLVAGSPNEAAESKIICNLGSAYDIPSSVTMRFQISSKTLTYMKIRAANAERVHTDALLAVLWPWHGLHRHGQFGLAPRN